MVVKQKIKIELTNDEIDILNKAKNIWDKIGDELDNYNYYYGDYSETIENLDYEFERLFVYLEDGFNYVE